MPATIPVYRCATTGRAFIMVDADPGDEFHYDRVQEVYDGTLVGHDLRLEPSGVTSCGKPPATPTGVVFRVDIESVQSTGTPVRPPAWSTTEREAYVALGAEQARINALDEAAWRAEQDAERAAEEAAERAEADKEAKAYWADVDMTDRMRDDSWNEEPDAPRGRGIVFDDEDPDAPKSRFQSDDWPFENDPDEA
jgi:hypothetical protein